MFSFRPPRAHRRPSLTPMIDVVFLLLVFFMLAARFGQDFALPASSAAGGAAEADGPPRLLTLGNGTLALNGVSMTTPQAIGELTRLLPDRSPVVFIQPRSGATVQQLVELVDRLKAAGFANISVVSGK